MENLPVLAFLLCLSAQAFARTNFRFERQVGQDECYTPRGEQRVCLNIKNCPPLLNLLRTSKQNRTVVDYLRRMKCGYEGLDPKVCCPVEQNNGVNEPGGSTSNNGDSIRSGSISNLPTEPYCGKSAVLDLPRIVGGRPAELGQWPWMAAIGFRRRRGSTTKTNWLCGGVLVTDRYVLTAAHCLFDSSQVPFTVRLGDLDLNENVADGADPVEIEIEKLIPHEKYIKTEFQFDIALLRLKQPVQFTKLIQPICLPKSPELRSNDFKRLNPFSAGWGSVQFKGPKSSHLQEIQLPVLDNQVCGDKFNFRTTITDSQLCAGYLTGGKDTCQGDSGGPLMLPRGEYFYSIGIVSFGYRCAEKGYPAVYTRVTSYVDWISQNIKA